MSYSVLYQLNSYVTSVRLFAYLQDALEFAVLHCGLRVLDLRQAQLVWVR